MKASTGSSEVDQILGLLTFQPTTLLTIRGLVEFLSLCKVKKRINANLQCNNKILWREVLVVAEARSADDNYSTTGVGVLDRVHSVDAKAMRVDDEVATGLYRRAVTRHVLFYALYKPIYAGLPADGVVFGLMWLAAQVETFLARKNGSQKMIVGIIKTELARVRSNGRDYPPVPAGLFVAAIRLVAEVQDKRHKPQPQPGRPRIDELCTYVETQADYY